MSTNAPIDRPENTRRGSSPDIESERMAEHLQELIRAREELQQFGVHRTTRTDTGEELTRGVPPPAPEPYETDEDRADLLRVMDMQLIRKLREANHNGRNIGWLSLTHFNEWRQDAIKNMNKGDFLDGILYAMFAYIAQNRRPDESMGQLMRRLEGEYIDPRQPTVYQGIDAAQAERVWTTESSTIVGSTPMHDGSITELDEPHRESESPNNETENNNGVEY